MRFLCLHGMGTNSKIFEVQTARIRLSLGGEHEYIFIDGSVTAPAAPGVQDLASNTTEFFRYAADNDLRTAMEFYTNIEDFIFSEGPFDGLIGFSEGAGVGASLLAYQEKTAAEGNETLFSFRCGIFFSAAPPVDIHAMHNGKLRRLSSEVDGVCIRVPTAHIWDPRDEVHPGFGEVLRGLCTQEGKEEFEHVSGHVVPGTQSDEEVKETVRAMRRTIERARDTQLPVVPLKYTI
ncbi:serine hydrolase FSH [Paraphoma chrysanthemicola]|uniref:Serine hydrolase FSH n=1 Tax=Paraphoma chrysanthemicola TaxID=798071 RepID=A0A8K0QTQ6_9PLEO|nr:serine hydrolase FSH [Paraphoma chrysanthemicola]